MVREYYYYDDETPKLRRAREGWERRVNKGHICIDRKCGGGSTGYNIDNPSATIFIQFP